jgi:hypothetical protein
MVDCETECAGRARDATRMYIHPPKTTPQFGKRNDHRTSVRVNVACGLMHSTTMFRFVSVI